MFCWRQISNGTAFAMAGPISSLRMWRKLQGEMVSGLWCWTMAITCSCEVALQGLFLLHLTLSLPVCLVWPCRRRVALMQLTVSVTWRSPLCARYWGVLLLCISTFITLTHTLPHSLSPLISSSPLPSFFHLFLSVSLFLTLPSSPSPPSSPFPCTNLFSYFCGQPTFTWLNSIWATLSHVHVTKVTT